MHNGIGLLPYAWNNFMDIGIFLELYEIGSQVRILKFWPAMGRHTGVDVVTPPYDIQDK